MRKKFSLIELIAVVAIMAIIMAFALPAFLTMTKGQSVELAAREIGSKLKAVRSYAITNRKYTALVFVTSQPVLSQNYPYKSYRPCIVNSSNVFQEWVPDEKWEFLPSGVIIQDISENITGYVDGLFGDNTNDITNVIDNNVFPGTNSIQTLKGVSFKSTGDLSKGNNKFIAIGEGTDPTTAAGRHNPSNMAIIKVDQYTGRISYGNQ